MTCKDKHSTRIIDYDMKWGIYMYDAVDLFTLYILSPSRDHTNLGHALRLVVFIQVPTAEANLDGD